MREDPPRHEATYNLPYMILARCALREYETATSVPAISIREFPDEGYAEVIVGHPWVAALTEFRKIEGDRTAVTVYGGPLINREEFLAPLIAVNEDCAAGRRTGRPQPR